MCVYLWQRKKGNDRALAIFIFWFALMQLFEFFMWTNMQDHSFVSKLSFVSIQLQPFVLATSLSYFSYYTMTEKLVLGLVALASFIKALVATHYAFIEHAKTQWLSLKGPHCHLMWWFSRNTDNLPSLARSDGTWIMLLLIALIMIKPIKQGLIYFFLGFVSALISRMFFPREEGSLWCWLANFMGVIAIAS